MLLSSRASLDTHLHLQPHSQLTPSSRCPLIDQIPAPQRGRGSSTLLSLPLILFIIHGSAGLCTTGSRSSKMGPILRWVASLGFCILVSLTSSCMRSPPSLPSLSPLEWIRYWWVSFAFSICFSVFVYQLIFPSHLVAPYCCGIFYVWTSTFDFFGNVFSWISFFMPFRFIWSWVLCWWESYSLGFPVCFSALWESAGFVIWVVNFEGIMSRWNWNLIGISNCGFSWSMVFGFLESLESLCFSSFRTFKRIHSSQPPIIPGLWWAEFSFLREKKKDRKQKAEIWFSSCVRVSFTHSFSDCISCCFWWKYQC